MRINLPVLELAYVHFFIEPEGVVCEVGYLCNLAEKETVVNVFPCNKESLLALPMIFLDTKVSIGKRDGTHTVFTRDTTVEEIW